MSDISNPVAPFSGETDASIRDRMLAAVSDDFTKMEGDFIYDMLQPAALELERSYMELETQLWQVFPQSATEANLDALAAAYTSVTRNPDETDAAFRVRVLVDLAKPAGAGTAQDYRRAVADIVGLGPLGVALGADPGTVDFWVIDDDRMPGDSSLIAEVETALVPAIPANVASYAVAAASLAIDAPLELTLLGDASTAQIDAWEAVVVAYIATLAPGEAFDLNAMLRLAQIPRARYDTISWGSLASEYEQPAPNETFRASSVSVVL